MLEKHFNEMDLITSSFANVFRLEVIELDDRENV